MMEPGDPDSVRRYFDRQAREYSERSAGGIWRWLRAREARAVLGLLQPRPDEEILDAGSGSGYYTGLVASSGARVTALDFSASMLSALRQTMHIDIIEGDLASTALIPKFDKVLCAGALEFVPDPAAAVANLACALKPDGPGEMVLLVPADTLGGRIYRRFHRSHGITVNLFNQDRLADLLAETPGFRIDEFRRVTFNFAVRLRRVAANPSK